MSGDVFSLGCTVHALLSGRPPRRQGVLALERVVIVLTWWLMHLASLLDSRHLRVGFVQQLCES